METFTLINKLHRTNIKTESQIKSVSILLEYLIKQKFIFNFSCDYFRKILQMN